MVKGSCMICQKENNDSIQGCEFHYYCQECFESIDSEKLKVIKKCINCLSKFYPQIKSKSLCSYCKKPNEFISSFCNSHDLCKECIRQEKINENIRNCQNCLGSYKNCCRWCLVYLEPYQQIKNPLYHHHFYCEKCFTSSKKFTNSDFCMNCRSAYQRTAILSKIVRFITFSSSKKDCILCLKETNSKDLKVCEVHSICNKCYQITNEFTVNSYQGLIDCKTCQMLIINIARLNTQNSLAHNPKTTKEEYKNNGFSSVNKKRSGTFNNKKSSEIDRNFDTRNQSNESINLRRRQNFNRAQEVPEITSNKDGQNINYSSEVNFYGQMNVTKKTCCGQK